LVNCSCQKVGVLAKLVLENEAAKTLLFLALVVMVLAEISSESLPELEALLRLVQAALDPVLAI
jgi:hypothetical protein